VPEQDISAVGLCLHCQKKPGKPKFCSRSCAAAFNNRRSPKRGPQGKCAGCGAAIPTRQKRCAACAATEAEARRRGAENIQSFRTPAGEVRELPVQQAWIHNAMVFEPHPSGGRWFAHADLCGEFLDALLGVVFARPAYIRPEDVHRYAAWIDAFKSHIMERPWEVRGETRLPVAVQPLRDLDRALRDWVETILRADNQALFPTLALDAACFIEAHAHGNSGGGREHWRIVGMLNADSEDSWAGLNSLGKPRLKGEVTSRLKGTLTRCLVPPGGSVPGRNGALSLLGAGDSFVFAVERCHLTQDSVTDSPCVRAAESDPPRFDIAADLWFRGNLLLDPVTARPIPCLTAQADLLWRWNGRETPAEIPVRWITDVYEQSETDGPPRPLPVLRWTV
jgi:hypothetical protein